MTEPTTFAAVKALIDKGYITRRHNTGNKRKFYVYLTSEGAALRDILVPLAEKVNRVAVADIPPENINLTRETLLKMIEISLPRTKTATSRQMPPLSPAIYGSVSLACRGRSRRPRPAHS